MHVELWVRFYGQNVLCKYPGIIRFCRKSKGSKGGGLYNILLDAYLKCIYIKESRGWPIGSDFLNLEFDR